MKFNCGPTWAEYLEEQAEWHDFFALWPRRVGPKDCRWLEVIQRKRFEHMTFCDCFWETHYRPKSPTVAKGWP